MAMIFNRFKIGGQVSQSLLWMGTTSEAQRNIPTNVMVATMVSFRWREMDFAFMIDDSPRNKPNFPRIRSPFRFFAFLGPHFLSIHHRHCVYHVSRGPNSALGLLQTMQGEVLEPDVISALSGAKRKQHGNTTSFDVALTSFGCGCQNQWDPILGWVHHPF